MIKRLILTIAALAMCGPALAGNCFLSGVTDQYTYFVAVDSTDFTTRETGLSSFTVYRSRNGGAATAMTTPTINETSSANMPGVYELLLDEDMSLDTGDDYQDMTFHITATGMAAVTKEICITRPKITAGETVTAANGAADADVEYWNGTLVTTALETSADIADAVRTEPCGTETADTFGDLICNDLEGIALGTIDVDADVVAISGDTAAADNLESYTDGTTEMPVNAECINNETVLGQGTSVDKWRGDGTNC